MNNWVAERRDALIDNALAPAAPAIILVIAVVIALPFVLLPPGVLGVLAAIVVAVISPKKTAPTLHTI
jgi:hypothetical protein